MSHTKKYASHTTDTAQNDDIRQTFPHVRHHNMHKWIYVCTAPHAIYTTHNFESNNFSTIYGLYVALCSRHFLCCALLVFVYTLNIYIYIDVVVWRYYRSTFAAYKL